MADTLAHAHAPAAAPPSSSASPSKEADLNAKQLKLPVALQRLGRMAPAAKAAPPPKSAITLHLTHLVDHAIKQKNGEPPAKKKRENLKRQPLGDASVGTIETATRKENVSSSSTGHRNKPIPISQPQGRMLPVPSVQLPKSDSYNHAKSGKPVVDIFGTILDNSANPLFQAKPNQNRPCSTSAQTAPTATLNKRKRKASDSATAAAAPLLENAGRNPIVEVAAVCGPPFNGKSVDGTQPRQLVVMQDDSSANRRDFSDVNWHSKDQDSRSSSFDVVVDNKAVDRISANPTLSDHMDDTPTSSHCPRPKRVAATTQCTLLARTLGNAKQQERLAMRKRTNSSTIPTSSNDLFDGATLAVDSTAGRARSSRVSTTESFNDATSTSHDAADQLFLDNKPMLHGQSSRPNNLLARTIATASPGTAAMSVPNAALQPLPRINRETELEQNGIESLSHNGSTRTSRTRDSGNYVRLNLRNKAGSCRGARNVKAKSKAKQQWEQRRQQQRIETLSGNDREEPNGAAPAVAAAVQRFGASAGLSNTGLDAVDDYIDGVFTDTPPVSTTIINQIPGAGAATNAPKGVGRRKTAVAASIPLCSGHQQPCKLLTVKKTGPNKGRKFYVCPCPRGEQCHHFVWADDTIKAAQEALLKNKSMSGFIARQVASYMTQIKSLTVPELKDLARRHKLATTGKKTELLMRMSIWVRDEVAKGTQGLERDAEMHNETAERYVSERNQSTSESPHETKGDGDEMSCDSNESGSDDDLSTTDEELELTGEETSKWSTRFKLVGSAKRSRNFATERGNDDNQDNQSVSSSESEPGDQGNGSCPETQSPMLATLRTLFGFTSFRNGQEWAISRCLNQERSLLVAPTGFGKSLCFALPAAMMDGVCIVVSPLLSLIQDQMQVLPARIPAVTLSGHISSATMASTLDDIMRGRIKVVFVSPERLTSASFRRLFRPKWNQESQAYDRLFPVVSLLCVDEAHCLSQWAHNFRPSYLRLRSALGLIQPQSVLAITATAGPRVVNDICHLLQIEPSLPATVEDAVSSLRGVHVSTTDRDNIDVKCVFLETQEERLSKLLALLKKAKPEEDTKKRSKNRDLDGCLSTGSVIVYVWRQVDAEVVAENIVAAGVSGGIVVYHGGMDASTRMKAQSKFMRGKVRICVATIAFGLGINKADVAGVIHLYLSSSPEHYIQEIGRAGRNGKPAQAIALVLKDEVLLRHSLAHSDLVSRSQVKSIISLLHRLVDETLKSLPPHRSKYHPVTIALPMAASVVACDCKVETIETIVSLLEQRNTEESLLVIEGISYDSATVSPRRSSLELLAEKEMIAQAMLQCADNEPRKGCVMAQPAHAATRDFGVYSLSVAKCANCLGDSAEPRHVFAALRRLETYGEIDFKLDTSPKSRVLHIRLTSAGMETFRAESHTIMEDLVDETMGRFISSISSGANKVIDINHILRSVCEVSSKKAVSTKGTKSESLALFQSLVGKYFEAEGRGSALVDEDSHPTFYAGFSSREISLDSQMILSVLHDIHGGIQGTKLVSLGDPAATDYTALMIAKFLHGLVPASVPIRTARQHHLFGKMQNVRFDVLHDTITQLFHGTQQYGLGTILNQ